MPGLEKSVAYLSLFLLNRISKYRNSAAAMIIASKFNDNNAWVRTGQVYERMELKMASLNIKSAFLNKPIEVDNLPARLSPGC